MIKLSTGNSVTGTLVFHHCYSSCYLLLSSFVMNVGPLIVQKLYNNSLNLFACHLLLDSFSTPEP